MKPDSLPIAFTICSNNYLAKARVTAETFTAHHPDYNFIVFLVDEFKPDVDYKAIPNVEIVAIKDIVPYIDELARKYSIVELNTAVKPAAFTYLFAKYNCSHIMYLDPDLVIYDHFTEIEDLVEKGMNIIITPHSCSPIDDGFVPSEIHISIYGQYNLGFLAVRNSGETQRFLNWWHDRLMKYCYIEPEKGMFTDQLWINYAPIYFDGVHILKHLGYNVANWNFYERPITKINNAYYIAEKDKLKFIHFSHYKFHNPYLMSSQQNRHKIDDLKYMRTLVDEYQGMLIKNNQAILELVPCYYQLMYVNDRKENEQKDSLVKTSAFLKVKNKVIHISRQISPKKLNF